MNIVVGYLETPEGMAAVQRAASLAADRGAVLHLIGIVKVPKTDDEASTYSNRREAARRRLVELAAELDLPAFEVHVPAGTERPGAAILAVARSENADLIVIGMRRRSRVGKLVLGSTAQEILLDSECDVLSVKAS